MNLNYTFPNKTKNLTFAFMAIGILAIAYGFLTDHETHGTRAWASILINGFFFLGIALSATFFIAMNYAAESAWAVSVKRVLEAMGTFLPYAAVALVLVFGAGTLHLHHIYHWMDSSLYNEFLADGSVNPHYDKIIAGKAAYLNQPFFWVRSLVYLAGWIYFTMLFRKRSLEEDVQGGTAIHFKTFKMAAGFLVFFAVTSSTASWDWIMSIDTHWYSTLFGWYVFSGMWISGIIMTIFLVLYLKFKGHLEFVNESHLHDLGKWMFAISFLWCYLWFSQFMLIWYSDIPEEVTYFVERINNYRGIFFTTFLINLIFPMILLMARDTKRNIGYLIFVGTLIFVGHWMDAFLLVTPGVMGAHWNLGFVEIGTFVGFLGLFLFVVLTSLSKAPLLVKNHPFRDETLHHSV